MGEVGVSIGRAPEWIDLVDGGSGRRWRFDAGFLSGNWQCIYGRGCRGIHPTQDPERADGCCVVGAQLTDAADFRTVNRAVARLDAATWQHIGLGRRKGWFKRTPSGTVATRTVREGCIFLNRPGFAGGTGCALHIAAVLVGEQPLEWKPYVCWQLPLRRVDTVDALGPVAVLRRWVPEDFGPDRTGLHWWCTEAPEAFTGSRAVWRELEFELRAVVGDDVYEQLADRLSGARP